MARKTKPPYSRIIKRMEIPELRKCIAGLEGRARPTKDDADWLAALRRRLELKQGKERVRGWDRF